MKNRRTLLINLTLLTAVSLFLRTVQMVFQVYITKKIGSAGIGLLQLIGSVNMLAMMVAMAGVRLASIRLVAEERGDGIRRSMRACLIYSLIFGLLALFLLFTFSELICEVWLGDMRALLPLRTAALFLPFSSMSGVLAGYFTAVGRLGRYTLIEIAERGVSIVLTVLLLGRLVNRGIDYACVAILLGSGLATALGFLALFALYIADCRKNVPRNERGGTGIVRRMLHIALPLGLSELARTGLSTVENVLIPRGLRAYGSSSEDALSGYGIVTGMVMPVLMYPAALLASVSDLTIPRLANSRARGYRQHIDSVSSRLMRFTSMFAACTAVVMFCLADELGEAIYGSAEAAYYIRLLAPMVLIWYLDSVTDAMLKGLGEEIRCMRFSIYSSSLSIIVIWLLVPKIGLIGYIISIYLTRCLNFLWSISALMKITNLRPRFAEMFTPILCSLASALPARLLFIGLDVPVTWLTLTLEIALTVALYLCWLRVSGTLCRKDAAWLRGLMRG